MNIKVLQACYIALTFSFVTIIICYYSLSSYMTKWSRIKVFDQLKFAPDFKIVEKILGIMFGRKDAKTIESVVPSYAYVLSNCTGIEFPTQLKIGEVWYPVNQEKDAYVFSAYRNGETRDVVIIGIQTQQKLTMYCQCWFDMEDKTVSMEQSAATTTRLAEDHGHRYGAVLYHCKCPSSNLPSYISLAANRCESPLNLMQPVTITSREKKRNFTVCLRPIQYNYSDVSQLIEWIELNKILGAEKFIVYNYSIANDVRRVLYYYSERGVVDIFQWQLPIKVDHLNMIHDEIHYCGQVAALHDCLYRNWNESEFIVNIDLDEFIIPHSKDTNNWNEMLQKLNQKSAAYLFRNVFFHKEWNNTNVTVPNGDLADKLKLTSLQKVHHENYVFPPKNRCKYIARTSLVTKLMIHDVPGISEGHALEVVSLDIAHLHHYRNLGNDNYPLKDRIVDTIVPNKFGQTLIRNVQKVWSDLGLRIVNK